MISLSRTALAGYASSDQARSQAPERGSTLLIRAAAVFSRTSAPTPAGRSAAVLLWPRRGAAERTYATGVPVHPQSVGLILGLILYLLPLPHGQGNGGTPGHARRAKDDRPHHWRAARPDWVSRGIVSKESGSNTLMRLRLNRLGAVVATAVRARAAFTARATTGQCVTGVPGVCQGRDTKPLGAGAMGLTPGPGTPDRGRLGSSADIG